MAAEGENSLFVQTWAKILRRWAQDICKDKASNLGPAAGY